MMGWLADTLLYTGVLIALVLLVRQSVARHFGPQMAYALWALPLLRFIMPPLILPAEFSPASVDTASGLAGSGVENSGAGLIDTAFIAGVPKAAVSAPDAVPYLQGALLSEIVLLLWLSGAAVFLVWRAWTYRQMRADLLDDARPVGEAGAVRLVETPAVSAPVAFGVSDKVVALPMEFMGMENRTARDMAIEHELAHHRGWDLLANMLAQPILALHWFNPLAWLGWRAMRRDQEAACDARVMAARPAWEKAAYGQVIAGFAAGSRLALAAPMACPILGEKSIIHRLRSLNRLDISAPRRWAGRVLLGSAALALPLTASISYAEPVLDVPVVASVAPETVNPPAPAVPVPVGAPLAPPAVPLVPEPPAVPAVPTPPQAFSFGRAVAAPDHAGLRLQRASLTDEIRQARSIGQQFFVIRAGADATGDTEFVPADMDFDVALEFIAQEDDAQVLVDCGGETVAFSIMDERALEQSVEACNRKALNSAREALRAARNAVLADEHVPADLRDEIAQDLEKELRALEQESEPLRISACDKAQLPSQKSRTVSV